MKINIEDFLHKIDLYFKDKEPKDVYMIYIMVASSIFAVAYLLFWDSSLNQFKQTRKDVEKLQKKIHADEMFLQRNKASRVSQLEREIQKIQKDIIIHKDNNAYIKTKIETISSLIYDERTWGEYINSISTNAQKYNVKILELQNSFAHTNNNFGHLLDITIKSSAEFKNTLLFINSLEQNDLVVDLHDFNIAAKNELVSDLNISVWGIKY